jgi:hypothetical protein
MVHALELARKQLRANGVLVLIQPHQLKRQLIAITSSGNRQPVAALVNADFQRRINAAMAAIEAVVSEGRFDRIGISHHQFRVRLAGPAELRRYLHLGQRPPRFPAGGRRRLQDLWMSRPADARIEVTEFLSVIGLRPASRSAGRGSAS